MKILKVLGILIAIELVVMAVMLYANPLLIGDKYPYQECLNYCDEAYPDKAEPGYTYCVENECIPDEFIVHMMAENKVDYTEFKFNYATTMHEGIEVAVVADLINFPAGNYELRIWAANEWGQSKTYSVWQLDKVQPGTSTGMAIVNIDGVAYLIADPQAGITHYRIIIDGIEYMVDAKEDGSLQVSLEGIAEGAHSVELYAINLWGESTLAPFAFTRVVPNAPSNMLLIQ
jgi:hypothetical protein